MEGTKMTSEQKAKIDKCIEIVLPEAKEIVDNAPEFPTTMNNYGYYMNWLNRILQEQGHTMAVIVALALKKAGGGQGVSDACQIIGLE
jgi:hypothetical protein